MTILLSLTLRNVEQTLPRVKQVQLDIYAIQSFEPFKSLSTVFNPKSWKHLLCDAVVGF